MNHHVSLASESGKSLSPAELSASTSVFLLISGGSDTGSIFGPFSVVSAQLLCKQAQDCDAPAKMLSAKEGRLEVTPPPSLVTRRF